MNTHHAPTSRYYPVTKKDHGRDVNKNIDSEHHEDDIDTHTHSSRYVPAGGRSKFTAFVQTKDKVPDICLKSN